MTEIPLPAFEIAVFDNRWPAFSPDPPVPSAPATSLHPVAPALGRCEVVVYTDDHTANLGDLPPGRVQLLVDVWADRSAVLSHEPGVAYVLVFENRGEAAGTTLSHPHGQVYAYPEVPPLARRELDAARSHWQGTGRCVHCDVVAAERSDGERVVATAGGWVAWVPFAARFPYEVHLAPQAHRPGLSDLDTTDRADLAALLQRVVRGYDALWGAPLPYVLGIHQRPVGPAAPGGAELDRLSHVHVELCPPLRSATRRKWIAGSELAGGAWLSDVAPERAAIELRAALSRAGG